MPRAAAMGNSAAGATAENAPPVALDGVLWGQTSTVSLHDRPQAATRRPPWATGAVPGHIDAPVLGGDPPARRGRPRCPVKNACPEPLRDPVTPVFGAIGARTVWVSERPGDGTRLKLAANSWVATIVAATAQSIALAQGLWRGPRESPGT